MAASSVHRSNGTPRLLHATATEREAWEWFGDGVATSWGPLDEDLSIPGMLDGNPARGYEPATEALEV
jgi:hypothetical protein